MKNLKSNLWPIVSQCGECFGKEVPCCLQQMEAGGESCLCCWATGSVSGVCSESEGTDTQWLPSLTSQVGSEQTFLIGLEAHVHRKNLPWVKCSLLLFSLATLCPQGEPAHLRPYFPLSCCFSPSSLGCCFLPHRACALFTCEWAISLS